MTKPTITEVKTLLQQKDKILAQLVELKQQGFDFSEHFTAQEIEEINLMLESEVA